MALIRRSPNSRFGTSMRRRALSRSAGNIYPVASSRFYGGVNADLFSSVTSGGSASGILWQAPWAFDTGNGWTLTPAGRASVVMAVPPDTTNVAVRLALADSADGVQVLLSTTEDGRNGWLAGVVESGGSRWCRLSRLVEGQIVEENAAEFWVTTGVSDTPPSAQANIDVSATIASGVGYTLDVRLVAGSIVVYLDNNTEPTIKYALATAVTNTAIESATFRPRFYGVFPTFKAVGFTSEAAGARVISADAHPLTGQRTGRADVLVAVAGGNVYACVDGTNMLLVGSAVFPPDQPVSMAPTVDPDTGAVIMVIVGGGLAREFNPVSLLVSNLVASAGSLPGQTSPGTTTATIVTNAGVRLAYGGIGGDEQNIIFGAVGNHRDLDTGKFAPGAAWAASGTQAARLGAPVVAMKETSNRSLLVGTPSGIYLMVGDPAAGDLPQALPKATDMGVSGKDSMWLHSEGFVVAHSTQGLLTINIGGQTTNVSRAVLDRGISFPERPDDLTPVVARDPARNGVHVFLNRSTAAGSLHFWYDEVVGGYRPTGGGFHPDTFPWLPVAAEVWRGRLVVGCDDGYIRTPVDNAGDDDAPVPWYITLSQLATVTGQTEVEISRMEALLSSNSAPVTLTVLSGRTSEEVFKNPETVLSDVFSDPKPTPWTQIIRGPALLIRLAGTGSSSIESFMADVSAGSIKSGR